MKSVLGCLVVAVVLVVSAGQVGFADTAKVDGMSYPNVTVKFQDGKVVVTSGAGRETPYDLSKVDLLTLDGQDKFNAAEAAMAAGDFKKAAAAYGEAISRINAPGLKLLAKARAIKALDADGRWVEAVRSFLDVYAAAPTAGTWSIRPTNMPEGGSKMLGESANLITAHLGDAGLKAADVQHNLKMMQLEIYTKANDPKGAALAQQLNGASEAPAEKAPEGPAVAMDMGSIDAAITAKKYDDAVRMIDSALEHGAVGETAVKLFMLKGDSLKAAGKNDEACLAYLRIPAHYPQSGQCAGALLAAANLEKEKQPEAAKALYADIVRKFPHSLQAAEAKKNLPGSAAQP